MAHLNRRDFVKTSIAGGASLLSVPAVSWAQAESKPATPNDKMGVAVIGAGGRGGDHVYGFLKDPRTQILYICDADEKHGKTKCDVVEEKQGTRPAFVEDMREIFDDKSVDAISTATPNHWHALCGVWAMQAGKDAYIEKPVCHNIKEGAALIAAARKYERMCQVGTQSRSGSACQDATAFMAGGGIGDVNLARALCYKRRKSIGALGDYDIPEEVDFNLWSGPATYTDPKVTRPQFHYDWHWQRHYGNGDSGNQGPHQTDIARWGLGIDTHPLSVVSYGGRLGYKAERKDPDYVDAGDTANTIVSIYDYGDKTLVFETRGLSVDDSDDEELNRLFQSKSKDDGKWVPQTKGNKIGVVFYGTEGYVVQKTYSYCVAYDKDFNLIQEFKGGGNHYANFIDACHTRNYEDLNCDVREGHLSAAISHLGNISYYVGEENDVTQDQAKAILADIQSRDDNVATFERTVQHLQRNGVDLFEHPLAMGPMLQFDPENEVFRKNSQANEMLTRKYRDGFVCPTAADV